MTGNPSSWTTTGKLGKCATFNNSTSNVVYANVTDYNYTTEDFSWCMWLKKDKSSVSTSMYAFTVGRADYNSYGYGLQVSSSTDLTFRFGTSTWAVSMGDNEWHHLAFTRTGTEIRLYKDGIQYGDTKTFSGTLPTYSDGQGFGVGGFHYTGTSSIYPLIGSINDFRIYDHCLSAKEVYQIAQGLCLHYKLDVFDSSVEPDCSGLRNDGVKVGTITSATGAPRYAACSYINNSSYIKCSTLVNPALLTLNVWHKGTTGYLGNWEGGGGGLYTKNSVWNAEVYSNGAYHTASGGSLSSDWQMITLTYDGRYLKLYVNATLSATVDCGSYPISYHATAPWVVNGNPDGSGSTISSMSTGYWSDFRIYATALTQSDITYLYTVGASMDNTGTLFCGEIDETGTKASAQKNSVFVSTGVNEQGGNTVTYASTTTMYNPSSSKTYTPTTAANSCTGVAYFKPTEGTLKYRIELDVAYTGFEAAPVEGKTFNIFFQGNNRKKDGTWPNPWSGTNYATTALNNLRSLKTTVLSATSGKYHYSASFTMVSAWFDTYDMSEIGVRSDYSNGTAKLTVSHVRIYPERDFKDKTCSINYDGTVSTKELNESLF